MSKFTRPPRRGLVTIVVAHLIISIVHGAAHGGADIALSPPAMLFVFGVILAGPLVGLVMLWPAERPGSWVIAITMAGSLLFGIVNHFIIESADHVSHVAPPWQPLFAATAVLLAVTEGLGCGLALRLARNVENVA